MTAGTNGKAGNVGKVTRGGRLAQDKAQLGRSAL
jgi:hypothetical protein